MSKKIKNFFKKPMTVITILGISLIPALYNVSFLTSMWDPYGNLDQLPVAVVNQDKAASLNGKTLTIGDDMVASMKENPSLDFHFVSSKEARQGLEEGDYYMVVTLPEDTSEKAASLMTEQPEQVSISYQTSKGHSFVAAKMSDSAMDKVKDSLSQTITETYTKAVFDSMTEIATGMDTAASGSQRLQSGADQLVAGGQTLTNGLTTLSDSTQTLYGGANQLASGLQTYTTGVSQASSGGQTLLNGLTAYTDGVNQMADASQQISANSAQLVDGMASLQAGTGKISDLVTGLEHLQSGLQQLATATEVSPSEQAQITSLVTGLPQLQAAIQELNSSVSSLSPESINTSGITNSLTAIAGQAQAIITAAQTDKANQIQALQATSTYQSLSVVQQNELVAAIENSPSTVTSQAQSILGEVQNLQALLSNLQNLSTQLAQLQQAAAQINVVATQALPGAATALSKLSGGMTQVHQAVSQQLLPGSTALVTGTSQLSSQLSAGSVRLTAGVSSYTHAVDQLAAGGQVLASKNSSLLSGTIQLTDGLATLSNNNTSLMTGVAALASGSGQLASGSSQLATGSQQLETGLVTLQQGIATLGQSLSEAGDQLSLVSFKEENAQAVSTPVNLRHTDKDKVETNGVGMAPYMVSVALMVAALSANVIFVKHIDNRSYKNRWDWAKGKLLLNGTIASLAALILYGVLRLIGIDPAHPMATLGLILLASWTFMALVTALVGWNNRFGSFASLILLLLQLGSSEGTYPIELSPRFFQVIQPYLPMTYSVSGLRQTISMIGNSSHQTWMLSLFLIGFMGLGLLIYRPTEE
ncbi:TPA: YhgE/Pip domain-containing protein [Streptococcus suis]|nr:YhgE/Pip domain-containing protein [Streptococcus suis]